MIIDQKLANDKLETSYQWNGNKFAKDRGWCPESESLLYDHRKQI